MSLISKSYIMNFGHLAVFHAVAQTGSESRAAEQLMISQPAVSKQLKELERSLGMPLFDRVSKGMRRTTAGEVLAGYSRRIFSMTDEAEQAMEDLQGLRRGKLIVGASTTIGVYLLPEIFVRFRKLYPAVRLELQIANSEVILKRLIDGQIHLGLTEGVITSEDIDAEIIARDRLVAIAHPKHPLARKRKVTARMLCNEPFVVRETGSGTKSVIEMALAEKGLAVSPAMSLGNTEAIKRAVAGGVGVAIVSELAIRLELKAKQLVEIRLSDFSISRPLFHLQCRGRTENAAAKAFMAILSEKRRLDR